MANIFISYAHEDRVTALEIYDALNGKGFSLWIDHKNLLPGQEWKIEIGKAIRESDIFIACLSNNSVSKKGFVQAELKRALEVAEEMPDGEVYIIPIRLDDCKVPSSLAKWHWLNYFDRDEKEKLFKAIQNRVKQAETLSDVGESFFDAGERIKLVREELGLRTSQFAELLGIRSQREYETIEKQEKEVPLSFLRRISDFSGIQLEWLKHEQQPRYQVENLYLRRIDDDLEYLNNLKPKDYFLTLDTRNLNIGLIAQITEYRFHVLDMGMTLDFWNWIDSHWAIKAFYDFISRLSDPWHDIDGVILPANIYKALYEGEIHFLSAKSKMDLYSADLPTPTYPCFGIRTKIRAPG